MPEGKTILEDNVNKLKLYSHHSSSTLELRKLKLKKREKGICHHDKKKLKVKKNWQ